jgi:pimeloyl-ACP methyl ester carboxylesterase
MNKTATYEGKKISYELQGAGPVVMLVHGFGEDARIWQQQVNFLQPDFTVITPHLPGSGSSELIADMSMDGMADCLHFILQQEGIERLTLIGHSMGGYIALAFAEKYLSQLNGFGLFHSTAFADSDEKKETRRKGIQFINEKGAFSFLKNATPNLYSSYTKTDNPSIIEDHIQSIEYFSAQALVAYYEAMVQRPDRTDVLKQNKLPILFVLGREDGAVPLADGLKLVHQPNVSFVHLLERSGHMGMCEEPEQSNMILKNYLLKTN